MENFIVLAINKNNIQMKFRQESESENNLISELNELGFTSITFEKIKQGHICPYCGHSEMQINNYFMHLELEHKL